MVRASCLLVKNTNQGARQRKTPTTTAGVFYWGGRGVGKIGAIGYIGGVVESLGFDN